MARRQLTKQRRHPSGRRIRPCEAASQSRTGADARAKALAENEIDDFTLLGLLVLAFKASNVDVKTGAGSSSPNRRRIIQSISEDGRLTQNPELVRRAARTA
jgi:hypothetical protein